MKPDEPKVNNLLDKSINQQSTVFDSNSGYIGLKQNASQDISVGISAPLNFQSGSLFSPNGQSQFNITDLLLKKDDDGEGEKTLRAAIDYYKRALKSDNDINIKKEIIIKNYRLRVVDANKDLTDLDRKLMKVNKGTSIHVANSLIKPEIYRFSTRVSDVIKEVFPDLAEITTPSKKGGVSTRQHQVHSAGNVEYDLMSHSDQVDMDA